MDREKRRASQAKSAAKAYAANPEKARRRSREWRKNNLESAHSTKLRNLYGLDVADKEALLAAQGGVCACCGSSDPGSKNGWHVEHDHVLNVVRGITCRRCNHALGLMGDNLEGARRLVRYLEHTAVVVTPARLQTILLRRYGNQG